MRLFLVSLGALATSVAGAVSCTKPPPSPKQPESALPDPVCTEVTTPFVGTVCVRSDGARHPAVLLFGGGEGGDSLSATADDFASRGYLAASVAYFRAPGTPSTLVDVPVETAGAAIDALVKRADVDGARIGVMGISKGGEYALLVASTYPAVRAVVADVPSPVAWFGLGRGGAPTGCAWSRGGRPLPCVPQDAAAGEQIGEMFRSHQPVSFRAGYARSLERTDLVKAAFFPLERIRGPVLCLAADEDEMWTSRQHCEMAMAYLRNRQHPYDDRMISYPGAGHSFIVARDGPASAMNSVHTGSFEMRFGGTPEGDARAADAAWKEIYAFLSKALDVTESAAPR